MRVRVRVRGTFSLSWPAARICDSCDASVRVRVRVRPQLE